MEKEKLNEKKENEIVKTSLGSFQDVLRERERTEMSREKYRQEKKQKKEESLLPMRIMLSKIVKMGLVVKDNSCYNLSVKHIENQDFEVYEGESSPSWSPGISLYIDHPAVIEIAVPNDIKKEGELVIRFASKHPERDNFNSRTFKTSKEACSAFAAFLAENAVKIKRKEMLDELDI